MDEPTRRAWSKPELIVLVRGKPEEAVLLICKVDSGGANMQRTNSGCRGRDWYACDWCDLMQTS